MVECEALLREILLEAEARSLSSILCPYYFDTIGRLRDDDVLQYHQTSINSIRFNQGRVFLEIAGSTTTED